MRPPKLALAFNVYFQFIGCWVCFFIIVNLQNRNAETTCLSSLYPGDPLSFKNVAIVTLLSHSLLLIQ